MYMEINPHQDLFKWSPRLKHRHIIVSSSIAQCNTVTNEQPVCCMTISMIIEGKVTKQVVSFFPIHSSFVSTLFWVPSTRSSITHYRSVPQTNLITAFFYGKGEGKQTPNKQSIKIGIFRQAVYLGICKKEQVLHNNFQTNSWVDIGHGHYCTCPNGLTFSHIDKKINCQPGNFKFIEGDVLYFAYNPVQGKFKVSKENQSIQFDIEKSQGSQYAIFTYLYDTGDFVEIFNS